ncbi:MAG: CoA-binding protein [Anaerolineales bacterium]|nr:CoA-binding protein [Anaerolineales bacterium]MCW5855635.1 CoA-binding protein [Anaerolineales bacterium]
MDNEARKTLLNQAKTIAVVGHSDKPHRTSYRIAEYLRQVGYRVYAVNPMITEVAGERAYPSLADLPEQVDIVNVFRRSEELDAVVAQAVAAGAGSVWAQLGVADQAAAQRADAAGLPIVMDRCIMVDHRALLG